MALRLASRSVALVMMFLRLRPVDRPNVGPERDAFPTWSVIPALFGTRSRPELDGLLRHLNGSGSRSHCSGLSPRKLHAMRRWAWRHLDWHEAVDSIIASEAAEFRAMATSAEPRSGTGSGVTTRVLGSAKAREVSTVKAVTAT